MGWFVWCLVFCRYRCEWTGLRFWCLRFCLCLRLGGLKGGLHVT